MTINGEMNSEHDGTGDPEVVEGAPPAALVSRLAGGALARPIGGLESDPLAHYLAQLHSPRSRRTMLSVLGGAARILARLDGAAQPEAVTAASYAWGAPGALTYARVNAVVAVVADGGHVPVARLTLAALRGVARAAFNLKLLSVEERMRIDDVRAPKLSGKKRGRALTDEEIAALYRVCATDPSRSVGRRDAAVIAVSMGFALRRFEVSALDLADVRLPKIIGQGVVRCTVRHGKGDKHDTIVGSPDVALALVDWLEVRGDEPGPLFLSARGRTRTVKPGARLSAAGIYDVLARRAEQAGIDPIAPHDLRRTPITRTLRVKGDLSLVRRWARHARVETTAGYDERGDDEVEGVIVTTSTGYVRPA